MIKKILRLLLVLWGYVPFMAALYTANKSVKFYVQVTEMEHIVVEAMLIPIWWMMAAVFCLLVQLLMFIKK